MNNQDTKPVTIEELIENLTLTFSAKHLYIPSAEGDAEVYKTVSAINNIVMDIIGKNNEPPMKQFEHAYHDVQVENNLRSQQRLTAHQYGLGEK